MKKMDKHAVEDVIVYNFLLFGVVSQFTVGFSGIIEKQDLMK